MQALNIEDYNRTIDYTKSGALKCVLLLYVDDFLIAGDKHTKESVVAQEERIVLRSVAHSLKRDGLVTRQESALDGVIEPQSRCHTTRSLITKPQRVAVG